MRFRIVGCGGDKITLELDRRGLILEAKGMTCPPDGFDGNAKPGLAAEYRKRQTDFLAELANCCDSLMDTLKRAAVDGEMVDLDALMVGDTRLELRPEPMVSPPPHEPGDPGPDVGDDA